MSNQQTSWVHRGNTFFGAVDVTGEGPDSVVHVRYNGEERSTRLEGLTVEIAAHILLMELVLEESGQNREARVASHRWLAA